jgi:hypothetical protein
MRFRARLLLGLSGLTLALPAAVMAASPGDDEPGYAVVGGGPQAPHHTHKGLFGRRHCVECQRAYAKAHDGVDIPAPPPIEPGVVMAGPRGRCATCEGGVIVSGPVTGAGAMASANAPGYAVVGEGAQGLDPAPIGVYRAGRAQPAMAAMGQRPGASGYDSSVVPTGLPPGQVALANPEHNRPHVISHLFGIPKFGQVWRDRADKERQKHAAIAYDQPNQTVTELPASVVYGKK